MEYKNNLYIANAGDGKINYIFISQPNVLSLQYKSIPIYILMRKMFNI
jgi:hypothetical protein